MTDFSVIQSEQLLRSFVFSVERRTVDGPSGAFTRDVVVHSGAVAIVAVDANNRVALLRQYRAPLDRINLEIPAGTCDIEGENPLETAKRELLEEVGAEAASWSKLAHFFNSSGWTNQETVVFLAESCIAGTSRPEGPEESAMSIEWWTVDEVHALLASGAPLDGTATIGLYAWLARNSL